MPKIYEATLHGDRVKWKTTPPMALEGENEIEVYITIIENNGSADIPDGKKMAEMLQKLSANGGISSINDASEWQRSQRLERALFEQHL